MFAVTVPKRKVAIVVALLLLITSCDNPRLFRALQGDRSTGGEGSQSEEDQGPVELWTWVGGSDEVDAPASHGTKGVPAPANDPGARFAAAAFRGDAGNLWLFGGRYSAGFMTRRLSDLWRFDGADWMWAAGSSSFNGEGRYGTKGVPATTNWPGARNAMAAWAKPNGDFYLFGGYGHDQSIPTTTAGRLNDLWRYDGTHWTWVAGSPSTGQYGVYGTKSIADPANTPGARSRATSWTDPDGNLWLFGGEGQGASPSLGDLNDLWKFDGSQWTWVSGSDTADQYGTYGTKGDPAPSNVPGARRDAVGWTDNAGNLWLFGGYGFAAGGGAGYLNDLWRFDGAEWTWVTGSSARNQAGSYGTQGEGSATTTPGAREEAVSFVGRDGRMWLFGGRGYGDGASLNGLLNDLWVFDGSEWTWIAGSSTVNAAAAYGTKGVAAATNVPGSRRASVSWVDENGSLWVFGGTGLIDDGSSGELNDLWRFDP